MNYFNKHISWSPLSRHKYQSPHYEKPQIALKKKKEKQQFIIIIIIFFFKKKNNNLATI
jgi:hypothetical protein